MKTKYLVIIVLLVFITAIAGIASLYVIRFDSAPDKSEIPILFSGSVQTLYTYEVWDGKGYMLFSKTPNFADAKTIYFDRVTKAGLHPSWAWSGFQGTVPVTSQSASLGINHCTGYPEEPPACTSVDVFGQINDPSIAYLELFYENAWHKHQVASPGFAIRIDGFNGIPSDFRWLREDGTIVWDKQRSI